VGLARCRLCHAPDTPAAGRNRSIIAVASTAGFTINLSTNNRAEADILADPGWCALSAVAITKFRGLPVATLFLDLARFALDRQSRLRHQFP
jgi:hypothetical protein